MLTIRQIAEQYRTIEDSELPFHEYQFIEAVRTAAGVGDEEGFRELSDSMVDAFKRTVTDRLLETRIRDAHKSLLVIAYLADHDKNSVYEIGVHPSRVFGHKGNYGPAMSIVDKVLADKDVKIIGDVYSISESGKN